MLPERLFYGVLMIIAALGVAVVDLHFTPYYPLLFGVATLLVWSCAGETAALLERLPLRIRKRWFAQGGSVLIAWGNWLPILLPREFDLESPTIKPALAVFVGVGMIGFMLTAWHYREPGDAVLAIAGYLLVFFYIGMLSAFLFQVRWLSPSDPQAGAAALLLTALTPKMGDTAAFFTGRWLGRNRLAPRLSPGKTLEGSLGGLAGALATAWCLGAYPIAGFYARPLLTPAAALMFGLLVGLAAQVGDLMESLVKRDCGVKDAGDAVPGFGGLLDVCDSVLFSCPVAYLILVGIGPWTRA